MSPDVVGQRCVSEREPELGLGTVASVERTRVGVAYPGSGEKRLYARGTAVLKRVQFAVGETVATKSGDRLVIEHVEAQGGLLTYVGGGHRVREDEVSDITSVSAPDSRLMAGQSDPGTTFDLRLRSLEWRAQLRQSPVRGFLGGRLELIPHQFYLLQEISSRQNPRVLFADEVGLGKTIEACLVLQRLLATGKARRVLVLVPESLVHQWFVELLRRFNLWFSIYDEARCQACEESEPGKNPFLAAQWVLSSVDFPCGPRRDQALGGEWDVVVVDEAHHLEWTPQASSPAYDLVDALAQKAPALLLLTATPMQLGLTGHFARLRLLDPNRYGDYERFVAEAADYAAVASIAEKILESQPLKPRDLSTLKRIFQKDAEGLAEHLAALQSGQSGARDALIRTLLDQHGTGRVMFRNTRATLQGFPPRRYQPATLPPVSPTQLARAAREFLAEETGEDASLRYAFKEDPRIDWLVSFLQAHRGTKVLLIARTARKILALETALKERTNLSLGVFHEGLPLVQRDRQAAWFAEPDGAQLLMCSEIGSEGRNFQFAHHLVLFDLPLNPGLIEQRIGRLDRIGQTEAIRIHVPVLEGGADAAVAEWYHRGLDAFESPLAGANEARAAFRDRLLAWIPRLDRPLSGPDRKEFDQLIAETAAFRKKQETELRKGRDRLLELNSFDAATAEQVITRVRAADADPRLRVFLGELLDHFGVRVKEHEAGDVFLDPSHAYVPAFPSIPADGMLATFDRTRARSREDIRFLSADHPLVEDALALLLESTSGTVAFSRIPATKPNLLLEAIFVLEVVAEARWQVDRFLAPQPVRVLVDIRGEDLTDRRDAKSIRLEAEDGDLARFLEKPGFNGAVLKAMVGGAAGLAQTRIQSLLAAAREKAEAELGAEWQRLRELQRLNDHVRADELAATQEQLKQTRAALAAARLRLDSLRLILEGPV